MGRSVSSDLRLRIVCGVAAGETRRAAAARLQVAPSTAVRVQARYARTGSVEPAKQGRPAGSGKLGPHRLAIVEKVKARPDITMPDRAAWLEEMHGVTADPSDLSKLLRQEGFSCINVWLAPPASDFLTAFRSAPTYPVSGPRSSPAKMELSHIPVLINTTAFGANFLIRMSVRRSTVRPSFQSTHRQRRPEGCPPGRSLSHPADGDAVISKGRPLLSTAQMILAIFAANATMAMFMCARESNPRSQSPISVFPLANDGSRVAR